MSDRWLRADAGCAPCGDGWDDHPAVPQHRRACPAFIDGIKDTITEQLLEPQGCALMKRYATGSDLKSIFEFLLVGYQLKGDFYFPRISGVQVRHTIPHAGAVREGRLIRADSCSPVLLFANATWKMSLYAALLPGLVLSVFTAIRLRTRRQAERRS